ncbi:MAG: chemotaxis protein CheW [Planctomycetota bacterium]
MSTEAAVESRPTSTPPALENDTAADLLQLVTFVVGGEEYAVPILSVHEINRMLEFTRVPQAPEFVEGVINLRGRIIPVVDLRLRFGLPEQEKTSDNRIVVVEVSGRVIGFTVDRVNEVLRISPEIVDAAPTLARTGEAEYVSGVGKLEDRLLIMLDLDLLFGQDELDALDETTQAL